ncbi:type 2 periplasmic-binding domain-containing protein [Streptomyces smyrnaeus]|uniref:hypothetical protein n=1 Tax=Streptomyces smyrnaeus TaxID=1387713 RepID=UPI0033D55CEF
MGRTAQIAATSTAPMIVARQPRVVPTSEVRGAPRAMPTVFAPMTMLSARLSCSSYTRHHPGVEVRLQQIQLFDPLGPLRAGQVDVQVTERPVNEPALTLGPVTGPRTAGPARGKLPSVRTA